VLVYGIGASHADLQYLSGFPVSNEAAYLLPAAGEHVLFVNHFNHLASARAVAAVGDVRWGGELAVTLAAELAARGLDRERLALAGPLPHSLRASLHDGLPGLQTIDLGPDLYQLRLVRSPEEIALIRRAAELTDRGLAALVDRARPGLTEHELAALIEAAYLPLGGRNGIHYIGATSMTEPDLNVPAQIQSNRRLAPGDALMVELSASWFGYWGQVLRTFWVGVEPAPAFAAMHDLAQEVFEAVRAHLRAGARASDLVAAGALIDRGGFTICDDLVHMGGGGVYGPYLRTPASSHGPTPEFTYRAGMAVVVQPNVIRADGRGGVQYGELLLVTETGTEALHAAPPGPLRIG
jgi:Xaa-Pro aminopeptidase